MTYDIDEDERQAVLLAIGHLAVKRPGWHDYLQRIATKLGGLDLFTIFHSQAKDDAGTTPSEWEKRAIEAADEVERLTKALADPDKLVVDYLKKDKSLEVTVQHWGVKVLAASFAESLKGIPNYLTGVVNSTDDGPIEFTLRRANGKFPAQHLEEIKAIVAALVERDDSPCPAWNGAQRYAEALAAGRALVQPKGD